MQLTLTVVSDQHYEQGDDTERTFDIRGGTIGRSAVCDWVVADSRNVISSRHAEISHNGRGYLITDTSTNGVYVNTTSAPLGRGNSAPLTDGDILYLASLVLRVRIAPAGWGGRDSGAPPVPGRAMPRPEPAAPGHSPFRASPLTPLGAPSGRNGLTHGPAASASWSTETQAPRRAQDGPLARRLGVPTPATPPPLSSPSPAAVSASGRVALIPDDFDLLAANPAVAPLAPTPGRTILPPLTFLTPEAPAEPVGLPPKLPPFPDLPPFDAEAPSPEALRGSERVSSETERADDPLKAFRQRLAERPALPTLGGPFARPVAPLDPGTEVSPFWAGMGLDTGEAAPVSTDAALRACGRALRAAIGALAALTATGEPATSEGVGPRVAGDLKGNILSALATGDFVLEALVIELADQVREQQDATAKAWADMLASCFAELDPETILAAARLESETPSEVALGTTLKARAWDLLVERIEPLTAALWLPAPQGQPPGRLDPSGATTLMDTTM